MLSTHNIMVIVSKSLTRKQSALGATYLSIKSGVNILDSKHYDASY